MSDIATKIHEFDVVDVEPETELRVARMKVPGGWIYSYSYPLGLNTVFVAEKDDHFRGVTKKVGE